MLLSFLYQSTSSFWILTSFYLNQEYIAKNICINRFDKIPVCNGKCYLQNELSADSDKKQDFPNIKIKEIQPLFYQKILYDADHIFSELLNLIYPEYFSEFSISNLIFSVFQPPDFD